MPVLRFHLLTITHEQVDGSVIVTITTNAACHLYLRYSDIFPRIHRKGVLRRGLVMGWDARYCFAAYQHIEQNEAGDEWTHTFTWPGWEHCNTRYFYFWGTMGGQDMVSDTPIFWIHYLEVEIPLGPEETHIYWPDPHPEVTSVDGYVRRYSGNQAWLALRDGAGTSRSDTGHLNIVMQSWNIADRWYALNRDIILFDTSTIPAGSLVTAANLRLWLVSKTDLLLCDPSFALSPSDPASNIALVKDDYQTVTHLLLSDVIPYDDLPVAAFQTWVLNPDGLLYVIPDGITKLSLREYKYDILGVAPPWQSWTTSTLLALSADTGDGEKRPRLEVTHRPPL